MYLESHINVSWPEHDAVLAMLDEIGRASGMKLTRMDGHDHLPSRRTREVVLTGHSQSREDLEQRVRTCVIDLRERNFVVTRYKLEQALVDSRVEDAWGLLA